MRRLVAVLIGATLAMGCGWRLPWTRPAPPPTPAVWRMVVITTVGAIVWAYQHDPAVVEARQDAADGVVTWTLPEAGYTVCAARPGWVRRCVGVTLTRDTTVDLSLLEEPPPPAPPPPPPTPPPPSPPPESDLVRRLCGPLEAPTQQRGPCVRAVAEQSSWWPACRDGDGVACHRFTREVARSLAQGDPRWGLITKNPGEQQCTWEACGPHVTGGYGEDVVAYRTTEDPAIWVGADVVGGAGRPGASLQWVPITERRPGNRWVPVP